MFYHRNFKEGPLDCTHVKALGSRGSFFCIFEDMELRIIIQPPYALLVGFEAINHYNDQDKIVTDGVALHFLLVSLEIRW